MKQRTKIILEELKRLYPDAKCELNHETPFQLLVATILSAQTTDKKVNEVTESLFRDYPDVDAFLTLSIDELEARRVKSEEVVEYPAEVEPMGVVEVEAEPEIPTPPKHARKK